MIDLNNAKSGDFLLARDGTIFLYDKKYRTPRRNPYSHHVIYPTLTDGEKIIVRAGGRGTRTDDGKNYASTVRPFMSEDVFDKYDIVAILPRKTFLSQVNSLNKAWAKLRVENDMKMLGG